MKTSINFKHFLFQNKMDSIKNNLKPEIKEETEEEKIDIENYFHPVMSSCEEDQLTQHRIPSFVEVVQSHRNQRKSTNTQKFPFPWIIDFYKTPLNPGTFLRYKKRLKFYHT